MCVCVRMDGWMDVCVLGWMDGWMDGVPGVKAFFSTLALIVMGGEAHHRQPRVIWLKPVRGACEKTGAADINRFYIPTDK